ncbi:MAG: hypothetical protein FJ104_09035 [Deltaproteobacteria bacterium]|nr:hypothetical protein [Deltaproteobacteria bacterium]
MVVMPYNQRAVHFYAGDGQTYVETPPVPRGLSIAELETLHGAALRPFERLWLIEAESDGYDPEGLIRDWLLTRYRRNDRSSWVGVNVYLLTDRQPRLA